jgi:transcriptional regulator with XRE-family HTH domain
MKINQGRKMARGKRVIVYTCIGQVITRLMREGNLTYREVQDATGIPRSTIHGFCNGVIPENPDVLITLREYFSGLFKKDMTTDDLLFGKDEDRQAMKARLVQLERENIELQKQLTIFEMCQK